MAEHVSRADEPDVEQLVRTMNACLADLDALGVFDAGAYLSMAISRLEARFGLEAA